LSFRLFTINTAFNFITPEQGASIVITDIIVGADKNVSNVDPANVEVFQASAADTTTVDTAIVNPTNDNNIEVTIMFYRVPAEDV